MNPLDDDVSRRKFVGITVASGVLPQVVREAEGATVAAAASAPVIPCSLTVNGAKHELKLDPRITLLDLLRERLHLFGTKKGCDHGQCGACTILSNGVRINSCLTLAVTQDGKDIVTIEGLASGDTLHAMQAAFIEHDGFQCGFCTSGQICSAVAMLHEASLGMPSSVTMTAKSPQDVGKTPLDDQEIRERMAGNLCRCGAYRNIVAAIRAVQQGAPGNRAA